MPTINALPEHYIEFHDSVLSSVSSHEGRVSIELGLACIQKWERGGDRPNGTGWSQPLTMRMKNSSIKAIPADMPLDVWEGEIEIDEIRSNRLPRVEAVLSGQITLKLVLVSGSILEVAGTELEMELHGIAKYVEELPQEFDPENGAA